MKYLLLLVACATSATATFLISLAVLDRLRLIRRNSSRIELDDVVEDRFLMFTILACLVLVLGAAFSWALIPIGLVAAYILSGRAPGYIAVRKRKELRGACDAQLDTLADIVAMGVNAGMSFDASIDLYCSKFKGALAEQLKPARAQWESGIATRGEALCGLADKLESPALRRFAETSSQAISRGAPLAKLLNRFAQDVRRERRNNIEQQVEKAPVKMMLPMGLLMLPALLILVIGPALMQFAGSGF